MNEIHATSAEQLRKKTPVILDVNGVIGAGKTTYINKMKSMLEQQGKLKVVLVDEPVDKWKESGILERFYNDKPRWAYEFQTVAFVDRIRKNIEAFEKYGNDVDIYIMERSCYADDIFMCLLYDMGEVDKMTMDNYRSWYDLWIKLMPYIQTSFLYIRTPIDICMNRIKERNRPGEELITSEYQTDLQQKHDEFLLKDFITIDGKEIPSHIIDMSNNYKENPSIFDDLYAQLMKIINL